MVNIDLIPCGVLVIPKLMKIEAMVTCVSIRFDKISYELTYFSQSEQKTIWCHRNEFDIKEPSNKEIGFKQ